MSEFISGKEALIALANGEEVQYTITGRHEWKSDINNIQPYYFVGGGVGQFKFRLKPRIITINGIEVPKPFEPKHGDIFWYLDLTQICSYNHRQEWSDSDEYTQLGVWRTEEEIKQVVAALRSIFK